MPTPVGARPCVHALTPTGKLTHACTHTCKTVHGKTEHPTESPWLSKAVRSFPSTRGSGAVATKAPGEPPPPPPGPAQLPRETPCQPLRPAAAPRTGASRASHPTIGDGGGRTRSGGPAPRARGGEGGAEPPPQPRPPLTAPLMAAPLCVTLPGSGRGPARGEAAVSGGAGWGHVPVGRAGVEEAAPPSRPLSPRRRKWRLPSEPRAHRSARSALPARLRPTGRGWSHRAHPAPSQRHAPLP